MPRDVACCHEASEASTVLLEDLRMSAAPLREDLDSSMCQVCVVRGSLLPRGWPQRVFLRSISGTLVEVWRGNQRKPW